MLEVKYSNLSEEELRKRCREVWPDASFNGTGICGEGITSALQDGDTIELCEWYIGSAPQFKTCYRHHKRGMKRRPEAASYIMGERKNFSD